MSGFIYKEQELESRIEQLEATVNKSNFSGGLEGQDPTNAQIDSACLSYRHDYGLMTHQERTALRHQAKEWLYAWQKEFGLR